MNHRELVSKALKSKKVKKEYDLLTPEYKLFKRLLAARKKAGLSQAEIAEKMGTKPPAVTRLETSLINGKHSPSLATLEKYAQALGCHLDIRLVQA